MKPDKKDVIDNPAMPSWYVAEVKANRKFYYWFWRGFFVAVPVTFILGHDMNADRFIRNFSLLYMAILFGAVIINRKSKGIKLGVPLELFLKSPIAIKAKNMSMNSVIFITGHAIGFVTFNLIFRLIFKNA